MHATCAGRWLLEYARGRDVSALFHSIHLRSGELSNRALKRLPRLDASHAAVPSEPVEAPSQLVMQPPDQGPFVLDLLGEASTLAEAPVPHIDSPLRRDLQAMLQREFRTQASTKATPGHWARTILALVGTLACWAGWAQGSALACLLLPFIHWVLIAHTVHEATHGNLSTNQHINFWAQFTSHPICFNVFVWIPQHLLSHHQYTNDHRHDVDCHHFAPAMISDEQPPMTPSMTPFNEAWTFVWKGFLTTLGTCILQPLRTLLDKPTPNYDINVTPVPAAVSKRTLWLSVLPSFLVLLYPLVAFVPHAPLLGLWLTLWPWVGMSIIFTTMTQVSHVQAQTQPSFDEQRDERCWTARQITTSLDYSMGRQASRLESSVVTALCAGLNAQSLHHAMPLVGCAHFPRIYDEYAAICDKHGLEVRTGRHFGTAVAEMYEYMFANNAAESRRERGA